MITLKDKVWNLLDRADKSNDIKTKADTDGNYIRTPYKLCDEIIEQIQISWNDLTNKKILVVDTIEFIPVLLAFGLNKCNITYIAPYEFKGKIARTLGVHIVQDALLTWKTNMKFDVVIGNPPYQANDNHGKKLWPYFSQIAFSVLSPGGYIGFITPSGWLESNSSAMKKVRLELTSNLNLEYVSRDAKDYFEVGSDISYFIASKKAYTGQIRYTDSGIESVFDIRCGLPRDVAATIIYNIEQKVLNSQDERLPLEEENFASNLLVKEQKPSHPYKCIYSTANVGYTDFRLKNDGLLKIALNLSSSYYSRKAEDFNMPITTVAVGALMHYYPLRDEFQGVLIRTYLSSKLIRFFVGSYKKKNTGFNHAVRQRKIPKLEEKQWTDNELYAYFNLTQEEIDYIELTVKS